MNVNAEQLNSHSETEELLDWTLLGEHRYQIERRIELLRRIERETKAYFQLKFNESAGVFLNISSGKTISNEFVENARTAIKLVEKNLGNSDQIDPLIREYIRCLNNPKRAREQAYVSLRSRKCVCKEKEALDKLAEGIELISIMRKEIALYLDGIDLSARSIWMEWGDEKQLSTIHCSADDSERSRFVSFA